MSASFILPCRDGRRHGGLHVTYVVVIAWLLTLLPIAAAQACNVRLGALSITPVSYDPFAFAPVSTHAEVALDLEGDDACAVTLRLVDASLAHIDTVSLGQPGAVIFAVKPSDAGGVSVDPVASTATVSLSHDNRHAVVRWDFTLVQDSVLAPGTYVAPLTVTARPDGASGDLMTKGALTLTTLPRAQVNIAGASGAFGQSRLPLLDFGTLTTGETRRAFVQVRANSPVTVQISSKNHGVMANDDAPTADPIPYDLRLDGQSVDLSGVARRAVDPPLTVDGVSLPMDITIGNVDGKMAGRYSDVITIDVSS